MIKSKKMKKMVVVLLSVLILSAILVSGCSATKKASGDTSLEDIKSAGKLIMGLDDSFPPMGYKDSDGEIVGFDVDMAREMTKRMGVELELRSIDWDSKELELDNKKIDVIWNGFTITPERKEQVAFTKPYLDNIQLLVVGQDSEVRGKADLAGKKVGVQKGSSAMKALKSDEETFNSIEEVVEYPENLEALMDLKIGRTHAVVVDEVLGNFYIAKDPDSFEILEDNFGKEEFGIGLRKTDTLLLDEMNKVLDEMKDDGTTSKISIEWFGEDIVK